MKEKRNSNKYERTINVLTNIFKYDSCNVDMIYISIRSSHRDKIQKGMELFLLPKYLSDIFFIMEEDDKNHHGNQNQCHIDFLFLFGNNHHDNLHRLDIGRNLDLYYHIYDDQKIANNAKEKIQ